MIVPSLFGILIMRYNLQQVFIAVIFFLSLTSGVAQSGQYILRDSFCSNEEVVVGDQVFGPSNPSGQVVFPGGAYLGGDSVVIVELTYFQPVITNLFFTICEGDTLFVNGTAYHTYHPQGTEVIPNGRCDSIVNVQIEVLTPPFSNLRDTLCPDEFYVVNGTRYDYNNRVGYEILPGASRSGCDSIVAIDLEFRNLWLYIGEDRIVIKGDTVCVTPQYGLTPKSFVWLPYQPCPDSFCNTSCIVLTAPIVFTLIATDTSGCALRDEVKFLISNKNKVYAPNVFSPDARWPDNRFSLNCDRTVVNIKRFFIADRWGDLLYERKDILPNTPDDGWDGLYNGKVMDAGTYIFGAELERFDGTTFFEKGGFSLVR
jgi:gliding motility-associated-like protein